AVNMFIGSERQKLAYLRSLAGDVDIVVSLHTQALPQSEEAKDLALTLILNRKGRTQDAMTDSLTSLRLRARPEDKSLLDQLAEIRSRVATLTLRGPGGEGPDKYKQTIQSLEDQREKLEDEMSRRSAEFRVDTQPVSLDSIRAAI